MRVLSTGGTDEVMRFIDQLNLREARLIRELSETPRIEKAACRAIEAELATVSREAFTMMSVLESRCLVERRSGPLGYLRLNVAHGVTVNDSAVARAWVHDTTDAQGNRRVIVMAPWEGSRSASAVPAVAGVPATSPLVVARLLGLSEESKATLRVLRAADARTVTLRWTPTPTSR